MFVVNFNEKAFFGLPPTIPFSDRVDELTGAIAQTSATGQTALYDAVFLALHRLESGSRDKKALVVISDGGDNRSRHSLDDVLKAAEQTSTLIYTIGLFEREDPDQNPGVLRSLAKSTGGAAYFPKLMTGVVADCAQIAQDIRHQYAIGYVSSKPANPGVRRAIRVTASAPGHGSLVVRARSGYITPEAVK
jgi:VWFA-related protein